MSLLGYFFLLNALSCFDGYITVIGIQTGVLNERNWIIVNAIESYGLEAGIALVKSGSFLISLLLVSCARRWDRKEVDFTKTLFGAACTVYVCVVSYMSMILFLHATA